MVERAHALKERDNLENRGEALNGVREGRSMNRRIGLGEKWWWAGKIVERVRVTSNAGTGVSHSLGIELVVGSEGKRDWGGPGQSSPVLFASPLCGLTNDSVAFMSF